MTTTSNSRSARSTKAQRSRQSTRTSGSAKQSARQRDEEPTRRTPGEGGDTHRTTVNLPFVTAEFRRPKMHLPTGDDVGSAAQTIRAQLPSRERTLFYGALTLGAAFAVIDWPVALAIGVGSALTDHRSEQRGSR